MKFVPQKVRQQIEAHGKKLGLTGAALALFVNNAMAALPTEVTAAFQTQTDNWTAMSPLIWGLLALTTGGFALMKMFKKGSNRAI